MWHQDKLAGFPLETYEDWLFFAEVKGRWHKQDLKHITAQ